MLRPFFTVAMTAPGRHRVFRQLVIGHVGLMSLLAWLALQTTDPKKLEAIAQFILVVGIVEGTTLIGWRLTQLPKSQALEFLLTSPIQPRRLFLAEWLVGISRFALIWLSGIPILAGIAFVGVIAPADLWPLLLLPFLCGVATGTALTAWVYEPVSIRRIGEVVGLFGVLVYLVVGVLAGEKLLQWLIELPGPLRDGLFYSIVFMNDHNPFGVIRYWFNRQEPYFVPWIARERLLLAFILTGVVILFAAIRATARFLGHFHDRHYKPIDSRRASQEDKIGDRPLSWWAVRRVMEYSGRVNLWLAGGFSLLYAAFIIAGDQWPTWMGKAVFLLFEQWGGGPGVACALSVLAGVPAVFQFGLWDPTIQDRCRRLELLLLTELTSLDYWNASLAAAWKRGRGYFFGAGVLWFALAYSGRNTALEVVATVAGATMLWVFSFAVGFRTFSRGRSGGGIASLMTLGLPMLLVGILRLNWVNLAAFVPTGLCYLPLRTGVGVTMAWVVAMLVTGGVTVVLTRSGLHNADAELRRWFDANQGRQSVS